MKQPNDIVTTEPVTAEVSALPRKTSLRARAVYRDVAREAKRFFSDDGESFLDALERRGLVLEQRARPDWMKAGIELNPEHFETYAASPVCLDCRHPLTESDRQAPVCPYCGVA